MATREERIEAEWSKMFRQVGDATPREFISYRWLIGRIVDLEQRVEQLEWDAEEGKTNT